MVGAGPALRAQTVAVLRNADRRLRSSDPGDLSGRYAVVRAALATLGPVDAFFVAHFRGEHELVMSYVFDGSRRLPPEVVTLSPRGLSRWVRTSRRMYRYADDSGRMLHRGAPLGDASALSQDAVVVPLLDAGSGEAVGLVSAQSLQPRVFDEDFARAAEWLARALQRSIAADAQAEPTDLYLLYPDLDSSRVRNETDLINHLGDRLELLTGLLASLGERARAAGAEPLAQTAAEAEQVCERMQTEVAELLRRQHHPLEAAGLTPREQEIADLIAAEGLSNAELSDRLAISPKTVKTHVGHVLRKLGATQRSEIAWRLRHGSSGWHHHRE